jgi:hypothetical protein
MQLITNTASPSSVTGIASTGGGDFVVVWEDAGGSVIRARVITADGDIASDRFDVSVRGFSTLPSVTVSGDPSEPGFAVAWVDAVNRQIKMRIFRGIEPGDEIVVSNGDIRIEDRPVISRLSNQIVVAWATGDNGLQGVRAAFFDPDGSRKHDVRVDSGNLVNIGPLAGAALENNTFAFAWRGGPAASTGTRVRVLKADGTAIGDEQAPDIRHGEMAMSVLFPTIAEERGHFVIARSDGETVQADLFKEDGTEVPLELNVNTGPLDKKIATQPAVTAIQTAGHGQFIGVWTERRTDGDGTGQNVLARIFSELIDPGPVLTISGGKGNQTRPSITTDSNFLAAVGIAFLDDSVPGLAAGNCAVQATTMSFPA